MCRKRPFCQGQALRVANASLDMHGRASGLKYMRAMGGNVSDGGSGHEHSIQIQKTKCRKAKGIKAKCHPAIPVYQSTNAIRPSAKYQQCIPLIPHIHFQNTSRQFQKCQLPRRWMQTRQNANTITNFSRYEQMTCPIHTSH